MKNEILNKYKDAVDNFIDAIVEYIIEDYDEKYYAYDKIVDIPINKYLDDDEYLIENLLYYIDNIDPSFFDMDEDELEKITNSESFREDLEDIKEIIDSTARYEAKDVIYIKKYGLDSFYGV